MTTYSSSSEYVPQVNESDRAVVINRKELVGTDLVVDWGSNREDDDNSWLDDALNRGVSAANSQHTKILAVYWYLESNVNCV